MQKKKKSRQQIREEEHEVMWLKGVYILCTQYYEYVIHNQWNNKEQSRELYFSPAPSANVFTSTGRVDKDMSLCPYSWQIYQINNDPCGLQREYADEISLMTLDLI